MRKINVGLIGLGNVGSKVAEFLQNDPRFALLKIVVRDKNKKRPVVLPPALLTERISDVVCHPEIQIVMDASNDAPANIVERIIHRKKWTTRAAYRHTVLASKKAVAFYGRELVDFSRKHGVEIGMEATVCAGIPIVRLLREGHIPEKIIEVGGILNGTTNYMLTKMSEGVSYEEALRDAQTLGYAEADPHEDVSGLDAAYKLMILSGLCFGQWPKIKDVKVCGIENLGPIDSTMLQRLKRRLVASARLSETGLELEVTPRSCGEDSPLEKKFKATDGVDNLVYLKTVSRELYFSGPGAGGEVTAMAMISDLNHIASKLKT